MDRSESIDVAFSGLKATSLDSDWPGCITHEPRYGAAHCF